MPKILSSCGCSQEQHLPNCGHFGHSGVYLSRHLPDCDNAKNSRYQCTCNPTVRKSSEEVVDKSLIFVKRVEASEELLSATILDAFHCGYDLLNMNTYVADLGVVYTLLVFDKRKVPLY